MFISADIRQMLAPPPFWRYTVCILLTLTIGGLSGFATANAIEPWYATLQKPFFNPPALLFGPVWTLLYTLMGYAAGRIWCSDASLAQKRWALSAYIAQLTLNAAWSVIFFGLRSPGLALIEILLLLVVIAVCMRRFLRLDRLAGMLFWPYLVWVSFATLLNATIVVLN